MKYTLTSMLLKCSEVVITTSSLFQVTVVAGPPVEVQMRVLDS